MKVIFKLLFAVTLLCVVFTSCSDESEDSPTATAGKFVAMIDGVKWETDGVAVIVNGTIAVGGQDATKTMQVVVFNDNKGTYDCKGTDAGVPLATVAYTPSGENTYSTIYYEGTDKVGTITISEIDEANKTISGTFSSKVKRVVPGEKEANITSGSFTKVPYSTEAPEGFGSLSAKVDGTLLNAAAAIGLRAMGTLVLNGSTVNGQEIITISMPQTVTTGTYTLGFLGTTYYATYTLDGDTYESSAGTLKITSHNTTTKKIVGTFSFTASPFGGDGDDLPVTEGKFDITYQ